MKEVLNLALVALIVSAEASQSSAQCRMVKQSYKDTGCCSTFQPNNKTRMHIIPRNPSNPQLHSLEPQWRDVHGYWKGTCVEIDEAGNPGVTYERFVVANTTGSAYKEKTVRSDRPATPWTSDIDSIGALSIAQTVLQGWHANMWSNNPSLSANWCNSVFLVEDQPGSEFPPLGGSSPCGVGLATWCRLSSGVILSKWLRVLLLV